MSRFHQFLSLTALIALLIPLSLPAQSSDDEISGIFEEAVQYFYLREFDLALQHLNQVEKTLCTQEKYIEQCIHSTVIRANIFRGRSEFGKAEDKLFEGLALADAKLQKNHPLFVYIYAELSFLKISRSSYETAKEWADKAVEFVENFNLSGKPRVRAYLVLGNVIGELGNYREAVENYQQAFLSIEELERTIDVNKLLTQAHNNIGVAYKRLGENEKATAHFQSNLTLVKEIFGSNNLEMGYAYNNIGTVYFLNGDFGTASEYFQRSAEIFRINKGENHSLYAAALNNTGGAYYSMNDFERAADIFEKAQRIKENTLGKDHPDTAVGYSNLASIYQQNKNYKLALKNYELSISVRKNNHGPDHPSLITPYIRLGDFYIETERYELARMQFFEAERIAELRLGENHPDIWTANTRIAQSYLKEKSYDKAISYYQLVLHLMAAGKLITKDTYDIELVSYPFQLLNPITGIGETALKQYKKDGNSSSLEDSYYYLMWAADIVEDLQINYQSEASKLNLIDQNYSIYTHAIEVCNYLYKETSEEKWLDEILRWSEMSRSRIALELLQELQAKNFAGVPADVLEKERKINKKIADNYQQLQTEQEKGLETDARSLSAYRDTLFHLRQNLLQFRKDLESDYPEYFQLKYDHNFAGRNTVSQLLNPDETLINYIVSEDQVYALLLDKENISFHSLGSPDSLSAQITLFREAISSGNMDDYTQLAHQLFKKLVDPILPVIATSSLIIVPDQMLHYLPFEMLLTEKPQEADYYQMPYLIRDHQVSYVPSATVLHKLTEQKLSDPRHLLAVAPFNDATLQTDNSTGFARYVSDLTPLPLTRYETTEIAKVFEQRRFFRDYFFPEKVEILLGQNATKSKINSISFKDYGFIHFATHAFVNESDPALSGIAFWGGEEEDGVVYVNDIYNMSMNADLVVLGACETGLGTVYKGEGMIGFTRAFMHAGASNILVSMWRVNDQPTANLMIRFYTHVKEGYSYSHALQKAKLELINQPEFAAPLNWAAFVLQGR